MEITPKVDCRECRHLARCSSMNRATAEVPAYSVRAGGLRQKPARQVQVVCVSNSVRQSSAPKSERIMPPEVTVKIRWVIRSGRSSAICTATTPPMDCATKAVSLSISASARSARWWRLLIFELGGVPRSYNPLWRRLTKYSSCQRADNISLQ